MKDQNDHMPPMPGSTEAEARTCDSYLASLRAKREARYSSVPCRLADVARCNDRVDCHCPLRDASDCPSVVALARRRAAEAAARDEFLTRAARAKAQEIPLDHWHLLGVQGYSGPKYRATEALRAVEASTYDILVLAGPTGVGKSGAAAVWLFARSGLWRTSKELQLLDQFSRDWNTVVLARALVVDELGTEDDDEKGKWRNRLDNIVTARYSHRLQTCITTNLLREEARSLLGARICSRLDERGTIVVCRGESLRHVDVEQKELGV